MGWALFNSVEFLLVLGRREEAEKANREAETILSNLSDPMGMQQVALNRGILGHYRRDFAEAEAGYQDSLRRAGALGYPLLIVELHARLAEMYVDWGKPLEAHKEVEQVDALGREKLIPAAKTIFDRVLKSLNLPLA